MQASVAVAFSMKNQANSGGHQGSIRQEIEQKRQIKELFEGKIAWQTSRKA
jgi:hypothetical protein